MSSMSTPTIKTPRELLHFEVIRRLDADTAAALLISVRRDFSLFEDVHPRGEEWEDSWILRGVLAMAESDLEVVMKTKLKESESIENCSSCGERYLCQEQAQKIKKAAHICPSCFLLQWTVAQLQLLVTQLRARIMFVQEAPKVEDVSATLQAALAKSPPAMRGRPKKKEESKGVENETH
jgi:hypothetical protein